jgi:nucleoside-diphosphate-sugar epimerase
MARVFVTGGSGFIGRHLIAALKTRGHEVRALARSDAAASGVRELGAEPVRGDLDDEAALRSGMAGCASVFHLAALMDHTRGPEALERVNVAGTARALAAARASGVRRFLHLSTAAVFAGGPRLVNATEGWPVPERPVGSYPRTKALAEREVLRANAPPDFEVVILRPAMVWGAGDTSTLPKLAESVRRKAFSWVDGGRYPLSTCHVRNLVEAALLASERGRGGEAYFVTDGEPVELRAFLTALLGTQGLDPGARSAPSWLLRGVASAIELPWRVLPLRGEPPEHLRSVLQTIGQESTVTDAKARTELGYVPKVSREDGLAELKATARQ